MPQISSSVKKESLGGAAFTIAVFGLFKLSKASLYFIILK